MRFKTILIKFFTHTFKEALSYVREVFDNCVLVSSSAVRKSKSKVKIVNFDLEEDHNFEVFVILPIN